jgi:hypothetical protein
MEPATPIEARVSTPAVLRLSLGPEPWTTSQLGEILFNLSAAYWAIDAFHSFVSLERPGRVWMVQDVVKFRLAASERWVDAGPRIRSLHLAPPFGWADVVANLDPATILADTVQSLRADEAKRLELRMEAEREGSAVRTEVLKLVLNRLDEELPESVVILFSEMVRHPHERLGRGMYALFTLAEERRIQAIEARNHPTTE